MFQGVSTGAREFGTATSADGSTTGAVGPRHEAPRIIYIAGYGRSGSTILELALLNCLPGSLGVGEMTGLPYHYMSHRDELSEDWLVAHETAVAACGWSSARLWSYHKRLHRFPLLLAFCRQEYLTYWYHVIKFWGARSGVIIDSSKTAYLSFLMPRIYARYFDVEVVFLKRGYLGVLDSFRKGDNKKLRRQQPARYRFPLLRSLAGWCFANLVGRLAVGSLPVYNVNWDRFRLCLLEHGKVRVGSIMVDKLAYSKERYHGFSSNRLVDERPIIDLK